MPAAMAAQLRKVYVAVSDDLQEGFATLEWALKKWPSHPVSIVILHNISKNFVYTPFGKLPASSVSDEQEKTEKLISQYITFCGEVRTEILKVETHDEPIHKRIIDLISEVGITKLAMSINFMRASSWKSKSETNRSFYVHRHRPNFCELYIVSAGKLVFQGEDNDEGFMKDDDELMVAKMKEKNKGCPIRMFTEDPTNCFAHERNPHGSSTSSNSPCSTNQWGNHIQEIENYYEQLLSSDLDEQYCEEYDTLQSNPREADEPENTDSRVSVAEKIEGLRIKISKAYETIQLNRKEAKDNAERRAKAEWAISLCNYLAEDLDAHINNEITIRMGLEKELDITKEQFYEVLSDVKENKTRLNPLLELQSELSRKLQLSSLTKASVEAQLEKAAVARAEMVRDIEKLRQQRDILHRRIEFCKEKDAIGMATRFGDLSCSYREYRAEEIRLATDNFSERLRLELGDDGTSMYRGRINHTTVAIKLLDSVHGLSHEVFLAKVKLLSHIKHPHLVAMMGYCSNPRCIVVEYMHNGSLHDTLFSSHGNSRQRRNQPFHWHHRIRVAAEVCSGLSFLHQAEPRPIVHGNLSPSTILLNRNLSAKINGFMAARCYDKHDMQLDVHAFGVLVLQLLTGRNWAELIEEAFDRAAIIEDLDVMAGDWPPELAEELVEIAMRCLSVGHVPNTDFRINIAMEEMEVVTRKAANLAAGGGASMEDSSTIPSVFICPILQEVMRNPHVAADGFSYELEAIQEWLVKGNKTSPMTNLKLKHTHLTPNHTLRSLIQNWLNKRSPYSE
ncbi:putative U-box domain-containing protein 50 [Malania oleifera]|uniref:putative U-box domain-containing protein 50 n=1 Tax=Malania oleifera TaxID=397392 RepID=UPI0025ADA1A3|nr:putative U-box domain-containing protein 50 [Malania oleifera]